VVVIWLNGFADTGERQMPYYSTTINEIPVRIGATVTGKHYPATRFEPEEWPDVEITEVLMGDTELPEPFFQLFADRLMELECQIQAGELCPDGAEE